MNLTFQRMVTGLAALLAIVLIAARREKVWATSIIFLLRYIQSGAVRSRAK